MCSCQRKCGICLVFLLILSLGLLLRHLLLLLKGAAGLHDLRPLWFLLLGCYCGTCCCCCKFWPDYTVYDARKQDAEAEAEAPPQQAMSP